MATTSLIYIVIHMKINNTLKISLPFSLSVCGIIQFIAGLFAPARFIDNYWLIAIIILFIFETISLINIRFGSGEAVGHWGGRYIWQLEDADQLLFCWKAYADAEQLEKALIAAFKKCHDGKRPFANLKD